MGQDITGYQHGTNVIGYSKLTRLSHTCHNSLNVLPCLLSHHTRPLPPIIEESAQNQGSIEGEIPNVRE